MVGNIDDELTEIIKLKNVRIALIEWLPFDRNQLAALNIKLDSYHHRRGHIVTALQDDAPSELVIHDEGISCKVIVEDFSPSEFVHFRAMLNFPEEEGIIQKEELSGYINSSGQVIYGAELVDVEESKDGWVSIDVLTRIIVDLTMDTSQMIDSLLTEYQRNLLNLIYSGEADKRTKFIVIFAEDISVRPESPKGFFDGEELQNELEQVLNVLQKAEVLDDGYCISGQYGEIIISSNFQKYEQSFLERGFSSAIKIFLDDYSAEIWHLWDESKLIEKDIDLAMLGDITSLTKAQNWITKASSDAIMLHDILAYLLDSINDFIAELTAHDPARAQIDPLIQELAKIKSDSVVTTKRVSDTQKVIKGLETKMTALRDFSNALAERHMRRISDSMAQNTKSMMQMTESNNRASDALSIIELILAGSVIIEIVLMFFGEYAIPDLWPDALGISKYGGLIVIAITIFLWIGVFIFLRVSKKRLEVSAVRRQRGSYIVGRRINVENLEKYLQKQNIQVRNVEGESDAELITVTFELIEKKKNKKNDFCISSVVVVYDSHEEFLLQLEFETSRMDHSLKDCFNYLLSELEQAGVFSLVLEGDSC
jgi:WD repeat-containing protein 35